MGACEKLYAEKSLNSTLLLPKLCTQVYASCGTFDDEFENTQLYFFVRADVFCVDILLVFLAHFIYLGLS